MKLGKVGSYSCARVELSPISELTVKSGWYPLFAKKGETVTDQFSFSFSYLICD